jgi:DNA-binding response OmpR family regulator
LKENKPRILVVDDDKNILETLRGALEANGYVVDTALNGKEAIQKSKAHVFNLALLDIKLPDMDGVELLTRMRDTVPKMRKIMLTGYPTVQNAIEAVNRKADAYLVKPVDVTKLLATIEAHLELQREEKMYSEEKVAEFIETRVKELSTMQT